MNMAMFFWNLAKSDLFSVGYCTRVHRDKSLFTRYQKHTAMYNWLPFIRSDSLWEYYIEREVTANNLRFATDLFRRVIAIPTKLYNKHWDNFIGKYATSLFRGI